MSSRVNTLHMIIQAHQALITLILSSPPSAIFSLFTPPTFIKPRSVWYAACSTSCSSTSAATCNSNEATYCPKVFCQKWVRPIDNTPLICCSCCCLNVLDLHQLTKVNCRVEILTSLSFPSIPFCNGLGVVCSINFPRAVAVGPAT